PPRLPAREARADDRLGQDRGATVAPPDVRLRSLGARQTRSAADAVDAADAADHRARARNGVSPSSICKKVARSRSGASERLRFPLLTYSSKLATLEATNAKSCRGLGPPLAPGACCVTEIPRTRIS